METCHELSFADALEYFIECSNYLHFLHDNFQPSTVK